MIGTPDQPTHVHDWDTAGRWGVVLGISRCRRCRKLAMGEDFPAMRLTAGQNVTDGAARGPGTTPPGAAAAVQEDQP